MWLIEIQKALKKKGIPYKQVAWIHDEVQIECPEQYGDEVGKLVVTAANKAGVALDFRCPVDAEYKIGKTWADCH